MAKYHRPSCSTIELQDKVPIANLELLHSSGLSKYPMAITANEGYSPLDIMHIEEQIVSACSPQQRNRDITLMASSQKAIAEKDNFNLILDEAVSERQTPLTIKNCRNFSIFSDYHQIKLNQNIKFFIEIINCEHFSIEGITLIGGRNMLFLTDSSQFIVKKCACSYAIGSCLIINNSTEFRISECTFHNNLSAAIMVMGNSSIGEISHCQCSGSKGYFNHDAGIHLCFTSENLSLTDIPERCHEALSISQKTLRPHQILIKHCSVSHCRAQGIYIEGSTNCIIRDNILINNNKEGICLDWGSCYNVFKRNIVSLNGMRTNISKDEIEIDYISEYPLLEDGSSSMKLPGISLDNGCMNVIDNNIISNNYGGGIKMIRTAMFNVISNNEILYNAIGTNNYVPHFHGITALGMGAVNNEFNAERSDLLDFMPSVFNTIAKNTIIGHWQPIFYDKVSSDNNDHENLTPRQQREYSRFSSVYQKIKGYLLRLISRITRG
jgi:parallel beta-helix repeat protein